MVAMGEDGEGDGHGHRMGMVMVLVMAMGHFICVGRAYLQGPPSFPSRTAGGQFKREVTVDGQSHLLLIREEAGAPDTQV